MANDNLHLLSRDTIATTTLDAFITPQPDGTLRVNESGLLTYLSEQFGYYTAAGTSAQIKDGTAVGIVQRLKAVINREAWTGNANWPALGNNTSESVKARLLAIKNALVTESHALEAPYREFEAGMLGRANSLFNQFVVPIFPAGVEILLESRTYIETFVTDRGEESAPSPASTLIELDQNDSASITCSAPPEGRYITKRRIYRSANGAMSSAFQFQGEYDIAQTVIIDQHKQEWLGAACPTIGWLEPTADLSGLIALPNGIMLGFAGHTLYASEPYHPYAYPAKYDKPLPHDIVGIVAVGQSAFVGTTGFPYLVSGVDSASLSEERINSRVPCASRRSLVAIENAVLYASPTGLALYENGRVDVISAALFDQATWQSYQPHFMRAAEYNGIYYAFYTKADNTKGCFTFDIKARAFAEIDQAADAVFANEDGIYILDGTNVKNFIPPSGTLRTALWKSKTFRLAREQSFGWLQVDAEFPGTVTVRLYGDRVLHHTFAATSGAPMRNKPGTCLEWRIEVESNIVVNGIAVATITEELKDVL